VPRTKAACKKGWQWFNRQRQLKTRPEKNNKFAASAAVFHETGNFYSKDSV
jgi:hypothetical protein